MKYKVGDLVRLKPDAHEIQAHRNFPGVGYDYLGRVFEIAYVDLNSEVYRLKSDNVHVRNTVWCEEWLEIARIKQAKIRDSEDMVHGAILLENGNAICACCGGIMEADELNETWFIEEEYPYWVDFSEFIIDE